MAKKTTKRSRKATAAPVRKGLALVPRKNQSSEEYWKARVASFRDRVVKVFSRSLGKDAAQELGFHLVDWSGDLYDLGNAIENHEPLTDKELKRLLLSFLVHAPNHINAAAFILLGWPVTDFFDLGAVKGSGKGTRKPGARYSETDIKTLGRDARRSKPSKE
ncbi:MAG: hypothetical protein WC718_07475 [Phycisphaerales bacterium]|jgi:hypothetical protein